MNLEVVERLPGEPDHQLDRLPPRRDAERRRAAGGSERRADNKQQQVYRSLDYNCIHFGML